MAFIVNIVLGWVSVALVILLSVIYLLRVVNKHVFDNKQKTLRGLNKALRKPHIAMGKLVILTSFVHGFYASAKVISLNYGTYAFALLVLLGVTFPLRKQLKPLKGFLFWHRILTLVALVLLVIHIIDVGIIGPKNFMAIVTNQLEDSPMVEVIQEDVLDETDLVTVQEDIEGAIEEVVQEGNTYLDGVYTAVTKGYRTGLTVQVTIENNLIIAVEVTDHNEVNEAFWGRPVRLIPERIVEAQDPVVDVVSGASMTSTGIINGVIDALNQALIEGQLPEPLDLPVRGRGNH